ncbi:MAG: hypothetical protein DIZ80_06395 [endosymbiont of Galathealinum brachiosum]|uniref:Polymerase/histidinol phosphatase N-terminal domain-containing protein n=1 Tax=endosymbiont of Galathealinum brachiosum TaxID=2200906 RepID=A0A370DG05_9GAMM|nr:MAG: hypothetical protein DIZ80_06395 [endosymbiont of Galathealinum brachiosum]
MDISDLECDLNSYNLNVRSKALLELNSYLEQGKFEVASKNDWINLHCHSFYSYNGYGMSPSSIVWKAKKLGLSMIGLVDFDTLDGVDEFHDAGRMLKIKTIASMETRAYISKYTDMEINSPGEPGIAYHMISGLNSGVNTHSDQYLSSLFLNKSHDRNNIIINKINSILTKIPLNYTKDVLSLTPNNNPTERHICKAYRLKSEKVFKDKNERLQFWCVSTCSDLSTVKEIFDNDLKLEAFIRLKLMKKGGIAYQQPSPDNFPNLSDVNQYTKLLNGISVMAWVDGMSPAEAHIEDLIQYHLSLGAKGINIIPDRNYNIQDKELKKRKIDELYKVVGIAEENNIPIMVGTELNAPGLKFVDDFSSPELTPLLPIFIKGAEVYYGHTIEQSNSGHGYCSKWSERTFNNSSERNLYYRNVANNYIFS